MPLAIRIDTGKNWTNTRKRVSALFEGKNNAQNPIITPQLPTLENLMAARKRRSKYRTQRSLDTNFWISNLKIIAAYEKFSFILSNF